MCSIVGELGRAIALLRRMCRWSALVVYLAHNRGLKVVTSCAAQYDRYGCGNTRFGVTALWAGKASVLRRQECWG